MSVMDDLTLKRSSQKLPRTLSIDQVEVLKLFSSGLFNYYGEDRILTSIVIVYIFFIFFA